MASRLRLFDTHAHLDFPQFDRDREGLIAELRAQRVAVINAGFDLTTSRAALELAGRHQHVFAACGFHPHEAKAFSPQAREALEGLLRRGAVAVGEIGLDYYRDLSPREAQLSAFRAQLRLARKLDLPVILHYREAGEDFFRVLAEEGPVRGVWHAFSGDAALARRALALGLHLGIGGPLTYRKNEPLRQAVKLVPLSRLLIETDAPFLPPEPFRGKRNDPLKVRLVALKLAELLGLPLEELAEATFENACRLFGVRPEW
ncbi:TPA: TatD family deoxyribonuclease [Candidatus Bipolaricaulota bacterium]|nr:TatD family deoxyribonuclease [Candidatus Bipolaricaulota bacterium]